MADDGGACSGPRARHWASDGRALAALWGAPAAAMLAALALEPTWRAAVWTTMLTGMGVARLLTARRCGRIHCRVTGYLPGDTRLYLLKLDRATGKVSLDGDFKDAPGKAGFSFQARSWPHGWTGAAVPHGVVALR